MKTNKKLILPAIITMIIYLISYYIPQFTISLDNAFIIKTSLDNCIKLYTPAVVVYLGSYFIWAYAIIVSMCQEKTFGYHLFKTIFIGSLIGLIIYMFLPTKVIRPEIIGNNIFDKICRIIYKNDVPINACPSFHCFISTFTIIVMIKAKGISMFSRFFNCLFAVLIYASTLLTKQHYLVDVPCGILLCLFSYFISNKINLEILYEKINKIFNIK